MYYQYANLLAVLHFLTEANVPARSSTSTSSEPASQMAGSVLQHRTLATRAENFTASSEGHRKGSRR